MENTLFHSLPAISSSLSHYENNDALARISCTDPGSGLWKASSLRKIETQR